MDRASAGGAATKIVEYQYDVFNRRVEKNVDANADLVFEDGVRWVYDGMDIALVLDETGSLTSRELHGPAVDQILVSVAKSNATNSVRLLCWTCRRVPAEKAVPCVVENLVP